MDIDKIAEQIADGKPCPVCDQPWTKGRHSGKELFHRDGCAYEQACIDADAAYFLNLRGAS